MTSLPDFGDINTLNILGAAFRRGAFRAACLPFDDSGLSTVKSISGTRARDGCGGVPMAGVGSGDACGGVSVAGIGAGDSCGGVPIAGVGSEDACGRTSGAGVGDG